MKRPVSIVKWYFKLLYVIGAWIINWQITTVLNLVVAPATAHVISGAATVGVVLLGARLFRGADESLDTPRPWWKMTSRRRLSLVIGISCLLIVLSLIAVLIGAAVGVESAMRTFAGYSVFEVAIDCIFGLVMAFLYLNSAARLGAPPPRRPQPRLKKYAPLD